MAHTLRREWQTRTAKIKIKHVTGFSSSSIVNIENEQRTDISYQSVVLQIQNKGTKHRKSCLGAECMPAQQTVLIYQQNGNNGFISL